MAQPDDPIEARFHLERLGSPYKETLKALIKNGLYYLTVQNSISALTSFSSASSYIYGVKSMDTNSGNHAVYDAILKSLLGYVEKLQQDTKKYLTAGKKDDEEKDDWESECQIFGCEMKTKQMTLTFNDVVGMMREKEMIYSAIVYPLIYPNLYTKTAKGVLLYGPPGTGKTYLIKAAVKELSERYGEKVRVHFFPLTGADLKGKYVGETEKKIVRAYTCAARRACQSTDIWNQTGPKDCKRTTEQEVKYIVDKIRESKQNVDQFNPNTPDGKKLILKNAVQYVSVIFIDEFDAIGGDRSQDSTGMVANAVNTMLQMMDGLSSFENIITVCATNYPWNLDAALIRRFSTQIYCNIPTLEDITKLVRKEMKERLKIIDANKQTYCAQKVSQFQPSAELRSVYPNLSEGEIKKRYDEKKDRDAEFLRDTFNTTYTNDVSTEFRSLMVKMAADYYSNSDVSQMMQAAYNLVSKAALANSKWVAVTEGSGPEQITYYACPTLTKFQTPPQQFKDLQKDAIIYSDYMLTRDVDKSHELQIPKNIIMDMESIPSVFGGSIPEGKIEKHATSIDFPKDVSDPKGTGTDVDQYVNIRYIADIPEILLINDSAIGNIFYKLSDVDTINNVLKQGTPLTSTEKDITCNIIFSKAYDVNYIEKIYYDGITDYIQEIGQYIAECKAFMNVPYVDDPNSDFYVDTRDRDHTKLFLRNPVPTQGGAAAAREALDTEIDALPMYGNTPDQQKEIRERIMVINKRLSYVLQLIWWIYKFEADNLASTQPQGTPPTEFQTLINQIRTSIWTRGDYLLIHPERKIYMVDQSGKNPILKIYDILKTVVLTEKSKVEALKNSVDSRKGGWGEPAVRSNLDKWAGNILEDNRSISFLKPEDELRLLVALGMTENSTEEEILQAKLHEDVDEDALKKIIDDILTEIDDHASKGSRPQTSTFPETKKKLLYYHATFKPFKASWAYSRISGPKGILTGALETVKQGINMIRGGIKTVAGSKKEDELTESIVAYTEGMKLSTLHYLLARTDAIGTTNTDDDQLYYQEDAPKKSPAVDPAAGAAAALLGMRGATGPQAAASPGAAVPLGVTGTPSPTAAQRAAASPPGTPASGAVTPGPGGGGRKSTRKSRKHSSRRGRSSSPHHRKSSSPRRRSNSTDDFYTSTLQFGGDFDKTNKDNEAVKPYIVHWYKIKDGIDYPKAASVAVPGGAPVINPPSTLIKNISNGLLVAGIIVGVALTAGLGVGLGLGAYYAGGAALSMIAGGGALGVAGGVGLGASVLTGLGIVGYGTYKAYKNAGAGGVFDPLSDLNRLIRERFFASMAGLNSPEDDISVKNIVFASIFSGDSLDVTSTAGSRNNFAIELPDIYLRLYKTALDAMKGSWSSIKEYSHLIRISQTINPRKTYTNLNVLAQASARGEAKGTILASSAAAGQLQTPVAAPPAAARPLQLPAAAPPAAAGQPQPPGAAPLGHKLRKQLAIPVKISETHDVWDPLQNKEIDVTIGEIPKTLAEATKGKAWLMTNTNPTYGDIRFIYQRENNDTTQMTKLYTSDAVGKHQLSFNIPYSANSAAFSAGFLVRGGGGLQHGGGQEVCMLNLKYITFEGGEPPVLDYTKFLCYHMSPAFIAAAIKSYPSTYNTTTGTQLNEYNANRIAFMEKLAKDRASKTV